VSDLQRESAFAYGKIVNWREVQIAMGRAERVMRRQGYLGIAPPAASRSFHDAERLIDLEIQIRKGQQYSFGALVFENLSDPDQQRDKKIWTLATGAPMDQMYPSEFLGPFMNAVHRKCTSTFVIRGTTADVKVKCE